MNCTAAKRIQNESAEKRLDGSMHRKKTKQKQNKKTMEKVQFIGKS
jgi:hypothetical protein